MVGDGNAWRSATGLGLRRAPAWACQLQYQDPTVQPLSGQVHFAEEECREKTDAAHASPRRHSTVNGRALSVLPLSCERTAVQSLRFGGYGHSSIYRTIFSKA